MSDITLREKRKIHEFERQMEEFERSMVNNNVDRSKEFGNVGYDFTAPIPWP